MSTIRLVYLHGDAISCPQAIPAQLKPRLEARGYKVTLHPWDAFGGVAHDPGDILLGHAHPVPGTAFRASLAAGDWGRRVMMSPYNEDPLQVAWLNGFMPRVDAFLAICGPYWSERFSTSPFAWWGDRFRPLELAVDRRQFPRIKGDFNPPGRRRLLYIGRAEWPKNPGYLARLAAARPDWDWGWIGSGKRGIPGFNRHGQLDFRDVAAQRLVATYDLTLTVGTYDANPSTLFESMAWGLIPVCTPQSGYQGKPGIVNVPLDDLPRALKVLDDLQAAPAIQLEGLRRTYDVLLEGYYHWDRVAEQVDKILGESQRGAPLQYPMGRRVWSLWQQIRSPVGLAPNVGKMAKGWLKRTLGTVIRPRKLRG